MADNGRNGRKRQAQSDYAADHRGAIEVHRHLGPGLLSLPTKPVEAYERRQADTRLSSRNRCRWSTKT